MNSMNPAVVSTPAIRPPPEPASHRGMNLALTIVKGGPAFILAAVIVTMAVLSPYFLKGANLQNLGQQTAIICALALGQLLVIIVRGIDISVGSVIALTVVVVGRLMDAGYDSGWLHVLVFLSVGGLFGFVNGFMVVKGGIPQPLIVTLATLGIGSGLALLTSGGQEHIGMSEVVRVAGNGFLGPVPVPVILVVGLTALLAVLTLLTQWGRWIYAIGGNPDAATWMGVPHDRVVMSAYIICGMTAGFAGMIYAGRTDAASPLAGMGYELSAITAVVIGGASLFGGRGNVINVLIGALIIGCIRNGLNLMNVSPFWEAIAIGISILAALELDVLRRYLERRLKTRATRMAS